MEATSPEEPRGGAPAPRTSPVHHTDGRDLHWYIDKAVAGLVFVGGVSAILFIIGIFVFITREGFEFIGGAMNIKEFFLEPAWRPTSARRA